MSFEGAASFVEPKIVQTGQNAYHVQHGTDRNLIVEFYTEAVHQEHASEQAGHPVFKDIDFIRIRTPGLNGNTIERPVRMKGEAGAPSDPERFPNQWQAFRNQREQLPDGFPLEQWPAITKAMVLNLKAQGIHVVEQIRDIPDTNIDVLGMGGRKLRDLAKAYLDQASAQSTLASALAERDQFRQELEGIKQLVAELKGTDAAGLAAELAEARREIEELKAAAAGSSSKKRSTPKEQH